MQQPISLFRYFQALVSPICSSQQPITFIGYFQALVSPICSSQQPISLFGYFQALVSPICNSHVLLLANHSLLFLVGTLSVSCRNPETSLPLSLSLLCFVFCNDVVNFSIIQTISLDGWHLTPIIIISSSSSRPDLLPSPFSVFFFPTHFSFHSPDCTFWVL
jgi:hypothetical protein